MIARLESYLLQHTDDLTVGGLSGFAIGVTLTLLGVVVRGGTIR